MKRSSELRQSLKSQPAWFNQLFFKDPVVVGLAGVWAQDLLPLSRLLLSQLLTRRHCLSELKAKVVGHFEVVSKINKVHSNLNIASQHSINVYLTNQQKWRLVNGLYSCGWGDVHCMVMVVQCTWVYGIKPFMILTNINRLFALFTALTTNSQNNFLYQEDWKNSNNLYIRVGTNASYCLDHILYKSCIITLQKLSFKEFRNLHT